MYMQALRRAWHNHGCIAAAVLQEREQSLRVRVFHVEYATGIPLLPVLRDSWSEHLPRPSLTAYFRELELCLHRLSCTRAHENKRKNGDLAIFPHMRTLYTWVVGREASSHADPTPLSLLYVCPPVSEQVDLCFLFPLRFCVSVWFPCYVHMFSRGSLD